MEMWWTFDNMSKTYRVPVFPDEIKISCGSQNETVKISGLGECTIIQEPAAKTYTWSSWFPATKDPTWSHPNVWDPKRYVDDLSKWKDSGKPMRFILKSNSWNINVAVTIEQFDISEKAGDVDTIYYTIQLREYRFIKPRKIEEKKSTKAPTDKTLVVSTKPQRESARTAAKEYRVKSGDTLSIIGRREGIPWRDIAAKNGIKAPYIIRVGQVLKLR